MGQKVHPYGFRLGVAKDWTSTWYVETKDYAQYLNMDLAVRKYLREKLGHASVSRIQIERPANNARIIIHSARPGIVIGKKGEDIELLRKKVSEIIDSFMNTVEDHASAVLHAGTVDIPVVDTRPHAWKPVAEMGSCKSSCSDPIHRCLDVTWSRVITHVRYNPGPSTLTLQGLSCDIDLIHFDA